jgi:hypothetical protein
VHDGAFPEVVDAGGVEEDEVGVGHLGSLPLPRWGYFNGGVGGGLERVA